MRPVVEVPPGATPEDVEFLRRQAAVAGAGVVVRRAAGGLSEDYPDGSYGHVGTRRDLAGESA